MNRSVKVSYTEGSYTDGIAEFRISAKRRKFWHLFKRISTAVVHIELPVDPNEPAAVHVAISYYEFAVIKFAMWMTGLGLAAIILSHGFANDDLKIAFFTAIGMITIGVIHGHLIALCMFKPDQPTTELGSFNCDTMRIEGTSGFEFKAVNSKQFNEAVQKCLRFFADVTEIETADNDQPRSILGRVL